MNCDVLVVGASSSGLMAAISAAREGSSVVLMDRDLEHLDHAANTLFEGMAARSSISIESCYLVRVLDGMSIISPGGASVTIPAKGYFIDRQRFDERYLEAAEDEGVLLMRGEVKRTYADGGRRTVEYGEGEIDARVVVDASGVGSRIAAQAGLQPIRHPDDIAWALEATVEHPGLGEERLFQYWIGSIAPGWKATFSPAGGDRATLGVFVRGHGPDVQPFFSRFLQVFKAVKASSYRDIGAMRILSFRRGGDPIAVLPGEIVADSLMVTGGAAGQSGLAYSLRAGAICGSVAARAVQSGDVSMESLREYERLWRSEFYWEYRMARAALETLRGMDDRKIDLLVQRLSGKQLLARGSLPWKAASAAGRVALAQPEALLRMVLSLARG